MIRIVIISGAPALFELILPTLIRGRGRDKTKSVTVFVYNFFVGAEQALPE